MATAPQVIDGVPGLLAVPTIHLHLILDVSPSMRTRWPQTISGLNEYMDAIRKDQSDNDQPYRVTMTTFSADVETPYNNVELDSIPKFTNENLQPHGWGTALYDAIGPTVQAIDTTEAVLVVIITDGEENSSQNWDSDKLTKLMDERQARGNYTYAYLGVSKEAWGNAAKIGSTVTRSMSNITADAYNTGTYTGTEKSLGTRTVAYSAMMRSNSAMGAALNVNNFFEDDIPTQTNDVLTTLINSATSSPNSQEPTK